LERDLIERALVTSRGNRAQAARLLGIRRALLYARMRHLGVPLDGKE
jgi:DNA-binding NtrC family response regulator